MCFYTTLFGRGHKSIRQTLIKAHKISLCYFIFIHIYVIEPDFCEPFSFPGYTPYGSLELKQRKWFQWFNVNFIDVFMTIKPIFAIRRIE